MAVIASLLSVTVGQMTSRGKDSGPHIAAFAGAETIGGALMQVFFAVVRSLFVWTYTSIFVGPIAGQAIRTRTESNSQLVCIR